jgi:hypothetical protein
MLIVAQMMDLKAIVNRAVKLLVHNPLHPTPLAANSYSPVAALKIPLP